MKIVISSGHGKYVRGASGYLDEVDEARRVVNRVAELWGENGVAVDVFHDNTSTSQNQNLNTIVNYHNSRSRDYDVSVHFNAYSTTSKPMGTEVLYVTQSSLASSLSSAIASAGHFINRGGKKRTDLFFLNSTDKPAILIETCFVDSSADADLYRQHFEAICKRIAEVVGQITIGEQPEEPPPEPETPPPDEVTARVDISIRATGPVIVTINGQDMMVNTPGPEEPSKPVFEANHMNIICTVFGGSGDPNDSAYPPYDRITNQEISCALPYKWAGERPMVEVFNYDTGTTTICQIRDVGPWVVDDRAYVLGNARPVAEPPGSTIPSGKNKGRISNGAGIDITPAAAALLGIKGKGIVHWRLLSADIV